MSKDQADAGQDVHVNGDGNWTFAQMQTLVLVGPREGEPAPPEDLEKGLTVPGLTFLLATFVVFFFKDFYQVNIAVLIAAVVGAACLAIFRLNGIPSTSKEVPDLIEPYLTVLVIVLCLVSYFMLNNLNVSVRIENPAIAPKLIFLQVRSIFTGVKIPGDVYTVALLTVGSVFMLVGSLTYTAYYSINKFFQGMLWDKQNSTWRRITYHYTRRLLPLSIWPAVWIACISLLLSSGLMLSLFNENIAIPLSHLLKIPK